MASCPNGIRPVERLAAIFVHAALKRCYVAKCVVPDLRAQNFLNGMRNCLTSLAELSKIGDLARLNLAQRWHMKVGPQSIVVCLEVGQAQHMIIRTECKHLLGRDRFAVFIPIPIASVELLPISGSTPSRTIISFRGCQV